MRLKEFKEDILNIHQKIDGRKGYQATCDLFRHSTLPVVVYDHYQSFLLKCFDDFVLSRTFNWNFFCKAYSELSEEERESIWFLRHLIVEQFKEHCIETGLYKEF